MDEMLATNADAELILKLYQLRTEAGLRAARQWVTGDFWPKSAEQTLAVLRAFGTKENAYLRQVISYWEMAAALVLHGAVDAELFFDCNGENLFIFSKFSTFMDEIHKEFPSFCLRTQELIDKFPAARKKVDSFRERMANRAAS